MPELFPSFQNPKGFDINAGDVIEKSNNVLDQFKLFNVVQDQEVKDKMEAGSALLAGKNSLSEDNPMGENGVDYTNNQKGLLLLAASKAGTNKYMTPVFNTLLHLFDADQAEKNALLRTQATYGLEEKRETAREERQKKELLSKEHRDLRNKLISTLTPHGKKTVLSELDAQRDRGEFPDLSSAIEAASQPIKVKRTIPAKTQKIGKKTKVLEPERVEEVDEIPELFKPDASKTEWKIMDKVSGQTTPMIQVVDPSAPGGFRWVQQWVDTSTYAKRDNQSTSNKPTPTGHL
jgi:hypothetical protein